MLFTFNIGAVSKKDDLHNWAVNINKSIEWIHEKGDVDFITNKGLRQRLRLSKSIKHPKINKLITGYVADDHPYAYSVYEINKNTFVSNSYNNMSLVLLNYYSPDREVMKQHADDNIFVVTIDTNRYQVLAYDVADNKEIISTFRLNEGGKYNGCIIKSSDDFTQKVSPEDANIIDIYAVDLNASDTVYNNVVKISVNAYLEPYDSVRAMIDANDYDTVEITDVTKDDKIHYRNLYTALALDQLTLPELFPVGDDCITLQDLNDMQDITDKSYPFMITNTSDTLTTKAYLYYSDDEDASGDYFCNNGRWLKSYVKEVINSDIIAINIKGKSLDELKAIMEDNKIRCVTLVDIPIKKTTKRFKENSNVKKVTERLRLKFSDDEVLSITPFSLAYELHLTYMFYMNSYTGKVRCIKSN